MSRKTVITVDDITNIALEERRPGCEKGMLHEDACSWLASDRHRPSLACGQPTSGLTIGSRPTPNGRPTVGFR